MGRPRIRIAMVCVLSALTRIGFAETPVELAKFVIAQNADAHSKLNASAYTCVSTFEQKNPDGSTRVKSTVQAEWKQRGLERWVRQQRRRQDGDDPTAARDKTLTVFLGKRSAGLFSLGTANPNEIEYEDIANLPDAVKSTIAAQIGFDPMLSAFGTGDQWLTDELEKKPPHVRWEAERTTDAGGKLLFVLKRFISTRADAVPDLILSVDPSRGWLVTKQLWYTRKDQLEEEKSITATEEPASHVWYPSKVEKTRYTHTAGGGNSLSYSSRVSVDALKANATFPPEQFTVSALDLPVGVQLVRTTVTGEMVTLLKTDTGLKEVARHPWVASTPVLPPPPISSTGSEGSSEAPGPHRDYWGSWITIVGMALLSIGAAAGVVWYFSRKGSSHH